MPTIAYITSQEGEQIADVDVSTLTQYEAHDLRLDLTRQLIDPDEYLPEDVRAFYVSKIKQIKAFFPIV